MKKNRSLWEKEGESGVIQIIDQRHLPHKYIIEDLRTLDDVCKAIKEMQVRGAPLIGVTAAYGMYLACLEIYGDSCIRRNDITTVITANAGISDHTVITANFGISNHTVITANAGISNHTIITANAGISKHTVITANAGISKHTVITANAGISNHTVIPANAGISKHTVIPANAGISNNTVIPANAGIYEAANKLKSTRPTAINLAWAVDKALDGILTCGTPEEIISKSLEIAWWICENEVENCKKIGEFGVKLIEEIAKKKNGNTVNILTHCNAGWLATVEYGTATAPIYLAHDLGIKIHVWVDETRPRNQGAKLTAWELNQYGIPHTVIVDNAGGYLMQQGLVDIVIVGSDRTTYTGDVANKIGTYLKALAAKDNNVPFYVALPSTTIDWTIKDGVNDIPIEIRSEDEVRFVDGLIHEEVKNVLVPPESSPVMNVAFDVTPRHLITGLITERGICNADEKSIRKLFS